MAFEEKRAWIMVVVSVVAYVGYVVAVLGRAGSGPVADVAYMGPLLWAIGLAIVASIVLNIAAAVVSPKEADQKDQRDREIYRFGEYIGQWFVLAGALAALGMAMAEVGYFWIANTIYLGFVLSAVVGSTAKIVAYRRGFRLW